MDLFPLLPSVESAMDAVILFAALMENPQNRLRVDCKGVTAQGWKSHRRSEEDSRGRPIGLKE